MTTQRIDSGVTTQRGEVVGHLLLQLFAALHKLAEPVTANRELGTVKALKGGRKPYTIMLREIQSSKGTVLKNGTKVTSIKQYHLFPTET